MTVLVGDSNFTGYTGPGPVATDGGYLASAPFIAVSNGQVTTLNCWITPGTATTFVMGLYDGTLQRLVYSGPVTPGAAGLVRFPIAPTPVIALQAYQLLLISNTGTFQFGVDSTLSGNTKKAAGANVAYPTPVLNLTGVTATAFAAPAFYADGDSQALTIETSGTSGQTVLNTATVIARAFNRCRLRAAVISDEIVQKAQDELFLFLSDLSNGPAPLWAIDTVLLPFTQGLSGVTMPAGTIDQKNVNYRFMNPLQSSAATTYAPTSQTQVNTVGITWGAPAVPIYIQMSLDGTTWTTLVATSPNASIGQTTLYDLDGSAPALYYRVIAQPVPAGLTFTATNVAFYGNLYEVPMAAFSRDEWSQLSPRTFPGSPRQYWFERLQPVPIIHFWPVPQLMDQQQACAVVWRTRQIMDVGTLNQRIEAPQRWMLAIVDGLAEALARVCPEVDPAQLPILQAYAANSRRRALGEERENAPMKIIPQIYKYTR